MKKILLALLMPIALHLSAQEWEPYWVEAIKNCHVGDYVSAESLFNQTIDYMEYEENLEHPSVYMDRARVFMFLSKYENALTDVNTALASDKLHDSERIKAVSVRIAARLKLGLPDGYEEDMSYLLKNVKVPFENFSCSGCGFKQPIVANAAQIVLSCKLWCDASAQAALVGWCAFFPEFCVVNACNKAVQEIQTNCRSCCETFFDQDICAAPFADIVAVMQKYLPPCGCPQ